MTDHDILKRIRNGEKVGGLTGELFGLAADEIERLRRLLEEAPPAKDHDTLHASWCRLWCSSCGAVFTPPQKCDCEFGGMPELKNHQPLER